MFKNLGKVICIATAALLCSEGEAMSHGVTGRLDIAPGATMRVRTGKIVPVTGRIINKGTITTIEGEETNPGTIKVEGNGEIQNIEDFVGVANTETSTDLTTTLAAYPRDSGAFTAVQRPTVPFFLNGIKKDEGNVWADTEINTPGTGLTLVTESIVEDYDELETAQLGAGATTIYDLVALGGAGTLGNLLFGKVGKVTIDTSDPAGTVTDEVLILPANLGCRTVAASEGVTAVTPLAIHFSSTGATKKVKLTGDNTHYVGRTAAEGGVIGATIEAGTTVEIGADKAMLQSDITVQGTASPASPGVLTFAPTGETTYTIGSGKTLKTEGTGQVIVPENARLTSASTGGDGYINIGEGTTVEIEAGGEIIF